MEVYLAHEVDFYDDGYGQAVYFLALLGAAQSLEGAKELCIEQWSKAPNLNWSGKSQTMTTKLGMEWPAGYIDHTFDEPSMQFLILHLRVRE